MKVIYRLNGPPLPVDPNPDGHRLGLTESVIEQISIRLPKQVGNEHHENVLYISGIRENGRSIGLMCIQPEAVTTPTSYDTSTASHLTVLKYLRSLGLSLVAQVHCHPGTSVEHSNIDDEKAIVRGEGFWSLVIPQYGLRKPAFSDWGLHCYTEGVFRWLDEAAAAARLSIVNQFLDLRK